MGPRDPHVHLAPQGGGTREDQVRRGVFPRRAQGEGHVVVVGRVTGSANPLSHPECMRGHMHAA